MRKLTPLLAGLLAAGCAAGGPRPAVDIPPAPIQAHPMAGADAPTPASARTPLPAVSPAASATGSPYERISPEVVHRADEERAELEKLERQTEEFNRAWIHAGKPRFVLLLNRRLGGDVDNWIANNRLVLTDFLDASARVGDKTGEISVDRVQTLSAETRVSPQTRSSGLAEGETWRVEQVFRDEFRPAAFSDRDLAMRQIGTTETRSLRARHDANEASLEMNALNKYADLLIEILISDEWQVYGKLYDLKTASLISMSTSDPARNQMRGTPIPGSSVVIGGKSDYDALLDHVRAVARNLKADFTARSR